MTLDEDEDGHSILAESNSLCSVEVGLNEINRSTS